MKAIVDAEACTGCGLCAEVCPDMFVLGDDNIAKTKVDPVPEGLEDSCREAADGCPVNAIQIEQ